MAAKKKPAKPEPHVEAKPVPPPAPVVPPPAPVVPPPAPVAVKPVPPPAPVAPPAPPAQNPEYVTMVAQLKPLMNPGETPSVALARLINEINVRRSVVRR
jgi:hypothetical protein